MRVTIDLHGREFLAATLFIAALIALLVWAAPAFAHSDGAQKYPIECCSNLDCAPVDKVEIIDSAKFAAAGLGFLGNLKLPSQTVLTTKHGTAVVPENFDPKAIYDSTDGRMHACIRRLCAGVACVNKLICWFRPAGM